MTSVEVFIDPSCPWAWVTSRWITEVASQRELGLTWRSYCLEIRDDYGVAPTVPEQFRDRAVAAHAISHRMLRIFEAVRATGDDEPIGRLYTEWGRRYFDVGSPGDDPLLSECLAPCGFDTDFIHAADDDKWDAPIIESMEAAYTFGGPKTQTPVIVVHANPPYGFKGPVMALAPTGEAAVRLWDAVQVLAQEPGFFEITRPRANLPRLPSLG